MCFLALECTYGCGCKWQYAQTLMYTVENSWDNNTGGNNYCFLYKPMLGNA